jgi:hypothetical protein
MSGTTTPATGSSADIVNRIKAVLPSQWFPVPQEGSASPTPILDGVLTGLAWPWSQLYSLIQYVILQTRIATATGVLLDIIAQDFFGLNLTRNINEGDAAFSARIRAAILQPRATRPAMIQVLQLLTGNTPKIFVPANTGDTGAYTNGNDQAPWQGMAYGQAGGWGSLQLPFQVFIIAYRPSGGGVAGVGGYYLGSGWAGGGYGTGALEYIGMSMIEGEVTDAAIYATIAQTIPAGSIAWTIITNL